MGTLQHDPSQCVNDWPIVVHDPVREPDLGQHLLTAPQTSGVKRIREHSCNADPDLAATPQTQGS